MPNGVIPAAARKPYCSVMLPLELEREILLAQSSEIEKWITHEITLSREHRRAARVHTR